MGIATLMEHVEKIGHDISLEGDKLRIAKGKHLPSNLKTEIIKHKSELIESLKRDRKAKTAGFMIGVPGELYTLSISKNSAVYIEHVNGQWLAWRETYLKGRELAISTKDIANGETFDYVLMKAKRYFDFLKTKRREN